MAIMQGDLAEYPVPDLLQFIHASRKQGQLILESPAVTRPAGVFFSGGELVHAYCPPVIGVPALYQLLAWQQGRFAFLKGAAPPTRTAPPTILANLVLQKVDGRRTLRVLQEALGCDRHALAEELRLLVRTGWLRIAAGAEAWRRHLSG